MWWLIQKWISFHISSPLVTLEQMIIYNSVRTSITDTISIPTFLWFPVHQNERQFIRIYGINLTYSIAEKSICSPSEPKFQCGIKWYNRQYIIEYLDLIEFLRFFLYIRNRTIFSFFMLNTKILVIQNTWTEHLIISLSCSILYFQTN